jgi:hypothetical protein
MGQAAYRGNLSVGAGQRDCPRLVGSALPPTDLRVVPFPRQPRTALSVTICVSRILPAGPEPQPRSRCPDGRGWHANGGTYGRRPQVARVSERRAYPVRLDGAGCRHHPRQRVAAYGSLPAVAGPGGALLAPLAETLTEPLTLPLALLVSLPRRRAATERQREQGLAHGTLTTALAPAPVAAGEPAGTRRRAGPESLGGSTYSGHPWHAYPRNCAADSGDAELHRGAFLRSVKASRRRRGSLRKLSRRCRDRFCHSLCLCVP